VRVTGHSTHQQQRHARARLEQVRIEGAGQPGGDGLVDAGDALTGAGQAGPDARVGGVGERHLATELRRHPLPDDVQAFTVDGAH